MGNRGLALVTLAVLAFACSGKPAEPPPQASASAPAEPPPEPLPPPEPEPVDTGHACATATALCDLGMCTIKFKNDCDQPLTCDGFVRLDCRTPTELVEARGRGRQTFAAKTEAELAISANCTMGGLEMTRLSELTCK